MIDKNKIMNGVEKAVDFTNKNASKIETFVKKNELDVKAKDAAKAAGKGLKEAGENIGDALGKAFKSKEK